MRILATRSHHRDERTLAIVDIELDDHLKLFGIAIRRAADGSFRAWPPKGTGSRDVMSIPSELAKSIISAAMPLIEGGASARS